MKPFFSESCKRTDRDITERERRDEEERDADRKEKSKEKKERERRQRLGTGIFVRTIQLKERQRFRVGSQITGYPA